MPKFSLAAIFEVQIEVGGADIDDAVSQMNSTSLFLGHRVTVEGYTLEFKGWDLDYDKLNKRQIVEIQADDAQEES